MANKAKVQGKGTTEQKEAKHEFSYNSLIQHVTEPLFIISILALLTTAFFYTVVVGVPVATEAALKSAQSNATILALGVFVFFLVSCYFVYLYFASKKKNNYFIGVSLMILLTAVFAWWSSDMLGKNDFTGARDYATWAIFFGMLGFAYILWIHRLLSFSTGAITTIVIATALIHMMPAFTPSYNSYQGQYISDLDSNFHYREAKFITDTGHIADTERYVYPALPVTFVNGTMESVMDVSTYAFGWAVFMASVQNVMGGYGYSLQDIAILAPGVMSILVVFIFYLLLKEMFADMPPYNKAVALFGAFMLMMNPAFATRAIATDSENGTFGTFLLVMNLLLLTISCRKKSISTAFLAGLSFLFLELSWSGWSYSLLVLGIFGMFYAVASFFAKKSPLEHIPYFTITMLMGLLAFLFLHTRGATPSFTMPGFGVLWPLGGTLLIAFVLEAIRRTNKENKAETKKEMNLGEKTEAFLGKISAPIAVIMLLAAFSYVFFVSSPENLINYGVNLVGSAQQRDIIEMTTAEQRATCDNLDFSCVNTLRASLGMSVIYGIGMILVLFYFAFVKRSFGSVLVLSWSLPMLYGIIYKSQFMLVAGVPIVALGATIALILPLAKKDIQTLRVLPVLLIIFLPLAASLTSAQTVNSIIVNTVFGAYGGPSAMYGGLMADRIYWEKTFEWLRTTPKNTIILTWWDYGHWIAGLTDRISILDNTKQEKYMVQDVAKYHVVEENETAALDIAKKYNTSYVIIDYTMISKSGAPHFIGSSSMGQDISLKIIGASASCSNAVDCQNAIQGVDKFATTYVDRKGSATIDMTSEYAIDAITLNMPADGKTYGYYVEASATGTDWTRIVDKTTGGYGGEQQDTFNQVKARYIRVVGTSASSGNEFKFTVSRIFNPRIEGSYLGYGQCGFAPGSSQVKPTPKQNAAGGFDMTSELVFSCNTGIALVFDIVDGKYNPDKVYVYYQSQSGNGQLIPWKNWMEQSGSSILGVQSMQQILGNALNYPDKYADFPTFTTFVYVPKDEVNGFDYNKVMMTKLYLGDYLEEYQAAGLASTSIEKSKYFTLVDGFKGDTQDSSFYGYVKVYKANYPTEAQNGTGNQTSS